MVTLIGLALRLYFFYRWRPALVGFPDTVIYVPDARVGIFNDPLHLGGYSEFLRLLHGIRPHLSVVILVQHLLGVLSGLLLFGAVRRSGLPRGLGLAPAAFVLLGGSEIFVEHAALSRRCSSSSSTSRCTRSCGRTEGTGGGRCSAASQPVPRRTCARSGWCC